MFANPEQAMKTMSHEIGHWVDSMPDNEMTRGNILGRIGSLSKYTKSTL